MMSTQKPGKRHFLTLEEKVSVIRFHESNHASITYKAIANKYNVGKTQISLIIKNKQMYLDQWESNCPKHIKRSVNQPYAVINEDLWKWYLLACQANIPVNGPMLKEEALEIAKKYDLTDFKASDGWLTSFKYRQNLQFSVARESEGVDQSTVDSWAERLREVIRGCSLRDMYNMDETGILWRALPDESLHDKGKRCQGGRNAKMRLTVAFFVNAAGEKEAPIVIGKTKNPRCFKKLSNSEKLSPNGCDYYSNSKAWMTTKLMIKILTKLNHKFEIQQRKVILLLDNAPSHPKTLIDQFSNIKVFFFHKNTTFCLQPLDAGIIKNFKTKYRKRFLSYVASRITADTTASDIVKSVDVLRALRWIKDGWSEVTESTVANCFQQYFGLCEPSVKLELDDDPFLADENQDIVEVRNIMHDIWDGESQDSYLMAESDLPVHPPVIDINAGDPLFREKLRELATKSEKDEEDSDLSDSDYDPEPPEPMIKTNREALEHADHLMTYALSRNCTESIYGNLSVVIEELQRMSIDCNKQSNITG